MSFARPALSLILSVLLTGVLSPAQVPQAPAATTPPTAGPRYKLTIVADAATSKRVKKGRVSSQAVVKVTDENDRPMPAIAVLFTIPQITGGGASFDATGATSMATTDANGVATSGTYTSSAARFDITATASTPSGPVSVAIPVAITAAAAGAGISAGVLVLILAAVGGAAAAGIVLGTKGGGSSSSSSGGGVTAATGPTGSISGPGTPTLNPPK